MMPDCEMLSSMEQLTEEQWRERLSDEQYHILREHGTERAFTGDLLEVHDDGIFRCAGCGQVLFASDDKFDSGSGWPSFVQAAEAGTVTLHEDSAFGMKRTEVRCSECGGHLGHLFGDGPPDRGGQRYCINSAALKFEQSSAQNDEPSS